MAMQECMALEHFDCVRTTYMSIEDDAANEQILRLSLARAFVLHIQAIQAVGSSLGIPSRFVPIAVLAAHVRLFHKNGFYKFTNFGKCFLRTTSFSG